jgi:hypothetical protein
MTLPSSTPTSLAHSTRSEFIFTMLAAMIIGSLPIIHIPLTWIATFFHEISHGLVAIFTGGTIDKIRLFINGSGLCYSHGGIAFLVALSGYIGAVAWGMALYASTGVLHHRQTRMVTIVLSIVLGTSLLLWARDLLTIIILGCLLAGFVGLTTLRSTRITRWLLKIIGMTCVLDAIKSPLRLVDGIHYGDGATLADFTGIPELIWVAFWLIVGLGGAYLLWKTTASSVETRQEQSTKNV